MDLTPDILSRCMPRASRAACETWAPVFASAGPEFGIDTPDEMAGWLASMANESGQLSRFEEMSYFSTPPERIAYVFGNRSPPVNVIADWQARGRRGFDEAFFNWFYDDRRGASLGNDQDGDGYKYRGLGPGQVTGKANCRAISPHIGVDLVADPEQMLVPEIGARAFACYFKINRITDIVADGTEAGFLRGMRAMNSGLKEKVFREHHLVRWYECRKGLGLADAPYVDVTAMQRALMAAGFNLPRFGADGDLGNETRGALGAFQHARGLPVSGKPDAATLAALGMKAAA